MAVQTSRTLPAQFVEDLGKDLATQVVAQSGVPVVSTGIAGISQQTGEDPAAFKARQDAARAFTTRQQNLAGLAPQVAQQDALQTQAQTLAQAGVGSFQPFLTAAQQAGTDAATTIGGISTGAPTTQQVQDFMSPYQSQVIDATLAEFDRNRAIQEQLDRFAAQVTGIMGGYPAQFQTTNIPNPTPLQTALGVGTTLAGIYGAVNNPASLSLSLPGSKT